MMVFLKIFSKAEEPESIEDKRNALGGERGIETHHLKVQVRPGGIT
jgi:hypothetical protein